MRLLSALLVVSLPAVALADNFPLVVKGPVISGVTATEAWVAWETSHHEGIDGTCPAEAATPFLGNHNNDLPTLTLSPAGAAGTFSDPKCNRPHHVHLTGLSAGTHYRFTLDKPFANNATAGGEFTTATGDPAARFDFVVYGDNRDDSQFGTSVRADHKAVADGIVANEADAAFLVNTGDLALNTLAGAGDDKGYTEFFDVERGLLSVKPVYAAVGNHETMDTTEFDALVNSHKFDGSPHTYYSSFDWGSAHVVFLDAFEGAHSALTGNTPGVTDVQAAWLDQDLAAAHAAGKMIFVVSHQSPFSHPAPGEASGHGGSLPMQDKVLPLLLKYRALAVFGGHDHYYQRGHEGCIDYFVVGGGGAPMYEPDRDPAKGVVTAVKRTSYVVVSVDGTRASAIAKSASGSILDTFTFVPADGTSCGVPPVEPVGVDGGSGVDAGSTEPPDAGVHIKPPDAGTTAEPPDAGTTARVDAGTKAEDGVDAGGDATAHPDGCQCGLAGPSMLAFAGLALLRRRRR